MRLSYNWLKEYVNLDGITPSILADKLTTAGLEVEGIEKMAEGTNLVVGKVLTCVDHPDSDHLHITTVDIKEEVLDIVCGAPNVCAGQTVIVAKVGAVLPGNFQIKAATVRGQASNGMICSLSELGVDKKLQSEEDLNGIYVFKEEVAIGDTEVLKLIGMDDTILDIGLTPNRSDCNAMWNLAKEVGAILRREAVWPKCEGASKIGKTTNFKLNSTTSKCPSFIGKVVNKVVVKPSPKWMQDYLQAYGVKAINNVVDISNYVMIETGQPLHFYDLSKLPHREITVVDQKELTLQALDGIDYKITKDDLLITTGNEACGIAGIMGGEESKIDEHTTAIFIEAARFDAVSVRNTARRLGLSTEAASRFSKAIEPLAQIKAVDRCVDLLTSLADADDYEENVVFGNNSYEPIKVSETLTHLNTLLGTSFNAEEVLAVLHALEFNPVYENDTFTCAIPSYRTDILIAEDLDEEVIRLLGFDTLKTTLPAISAVGALTPIQKTRRAIKENLTSYGLSEIITYTLVSQNQLDHALMPMKEAVALAAPMSEDRKYVRSSLMPSMLESVAYNQNRKNTNFNVFEISVVYGKDCVQERLGIVLSDTLLSSRVHHVEVKSDFYTLKGILCATLEKLGFASERLVFEENTLDIEHFHPYRSAVIKLQNKVLGIIGEVHPNYAKKSGVSGVVYAEINVDMLYESKASKVKFSALHRFPAVYRDIALVVSLDVKASQLIQAIKSANKQLIQDVEVFDVYQGEHVQEGFKSVAISITYQSGDHTLTEQEIKDVHQLVLEALKTKCSAELRG